MHFSVQTKPHRHAHGEDQDELEPGDMPVEPDQGPTLPAIPADPESERVTEPEI